MKINNSIIIAILLGVTTGIIINRNKELIQGLDNFVLYGLIFIYIGISSFIKIGFNNDANTNLTTLGKRVLSILLLLFGLLLTLGPIFIRPCDRVFMSGRDPKCICNGTKFNLDSITFLHNDSDTEGKVLNYCVGLTTNN